VIGSFFVELAKQDMRRWFINLPDEDLAYFPEGTEHFGDYVGRAIRFEFWNDRLVGYNFLSSFNEDPSDFNATKIADIEKGKTTRAEIIQRLGPPTGPCTITFGTRHR